MHFKLVSPRLCLTLRPQGRCRRALLCRSGADPYRAAAALLVDTYVKDGQVVGLGTGTLVNSAVQYLGEQLESRALQDVVCCAASAATANEAAFHGVPLSSFAEQSQVNVAFDEADELELPGLGFILGRQREPQHAQLLRSRTLAHRADCYVVLLDGSERVRRRLGGVLPVLIEADDWEATAEELDDTFLGDAEIWRRPTSGEANARGGDNPYLNADGHTILDIKFNNDAAADLSDFQRYVASTSGRSATLRLNGEEVAYEAIAAAIESVPGVVTHGLVLGKADAAIVSTPQGPKLVRKEEVRESTLRDIVEELVEE